MACSPAGSYTAPEPQPSRGRWVSRIGFPAWPCGCHTDTATAPEAFDALASGTPVDADDPAS